MSKFQTQLQKLYEQVAIEGESCLRIILESEYQALLEENAKLQAEVERLTALDYAKEDQRRTDRAAQLQETAENYRAKLAETCEYVRQLCCFVKGTKTMEQQRFQEIHDFVISQALEENK